MYYRITQKLKIGLAVYFQVKTAVKWLLNHEKRVFNIFFAKTGLGKSEKTEKIENLNRWGSTSIPKPQGV